MKRDRMKKIRMNGEGCRIKGNGDRANGAGDKANGAEYGMKGTGYMVEGAKDRMRELDRGAKKLGCGIKGFGSGMKKSADRPKRKCMALALSLMLAFGAACPAYGASAAEMAKAGADAGDTEARAEKVSAKSVNAGKATGAGIVSADAARTRTAKTENVSVEALKHENAGVETVSTDAPDCEPSDAEDKEEMKTANGNGDGTTKEETVYVLAKDDGTAGRIIVSEWLKNTGKTKLLADYTELEKVENVKGNEKFQQVNGEGAWKSSGNDIYYQGEIRKALPVEMKISYYLDGKKVSAKELSGKSGKVTIRFDYTNTQKLDGVYVPFVLLTSMSLTMKFAATWK